MDIKFQQNTYSGGEKPKLNKLAVAIVFGIVVILITAIGTSVYFYKKANKDPQEDAMKELARVTKMVGKHIVLPEGETPTMATVSDPEKLKDQPFFANAKKGYKVLIFSDSRKAILYDPVEDKIVEVAPINASAGVPKGN